MVGSAVVRKIELDGLHSWVGKSKAELDLRDYDVTQEFIAEEKPDAVVVAAAKVGGIMANMSDPVGFLNENLRIQLSLVNAAHRHRVKKLVFLGSSCIYPKDAPQPIKEDYLLSGDLEPTNKPYAIAKIAGLNLINSFRAQYGYEWHSLMPTNLYGPNDNFDPETSHVIPGLIHRFEEAVSSDMKTLEIWGTGQPLREFLHTDDLAAAILLTLEKSVPREVMNVGSGDEISIRELAETIASLTGYQGKLYFNPEMPDGVQRKSLDSSAIRSMGWEPSLTLNEGLSRLIQGPRQL